MFGKLSSRAGFQDGIVSVGTKNNLDELCTNSGLSRREGSKRAFSSNREEKKHIFFASTVGFIVYFFTNISELKLF